MGTLSFLYRDPLLGHSGSNLLAQGLTVCWTSHKYLKYGISPGSHRNLKGRTMAPNSTREETGLHEITTPQAD